MIYDCFTFFNEIELLKIRLSLLYDAVDKFVLVEAAKTQTGLQKPYYFENSKSEFTKYMDKIIHITIDEMPNSNGENDWTLEIFQRNGIFRGLTQCVPEDIILISDVDEIPNPAILKNLSAYSITPINKSEGFTASIKQYLRLISTKKDFLKNYRHLDMALEWTPVALEQSMFYYFINYKSNIKWYGTVIVKFKNFMLPQRLRTMKNVIPYIKQCGGWHFSYLGGKNAIKQKLQSIIEGHFYKVENGFTDIDTYLDYCLKQGIDITGKKSLKVITPPYKELTLPHVDEIKKKYPYLFFGV